MSLTNGSSSFRGFAPPSDAAVGGAAEPGVMRQLYLPLATKIQIYNVDSCFPYEIYKYQKDKLCVYAE
ncbi:hypothetical protein GZ78_14340 [Endozoicomonas numazuensis]|uniref:Uncharacterized protein n=1 Tax=Endozoicomonas numazuensis TaxID=1137799 RepID=A0A081NF45_9GAMM|nr:hypothetical protein GZ78_14340 [Endozoicomonas numazuensis]